VKLPGDYGVVICNPPYGERIGDMKEIGKLYKNMGELFNSNRTWSAYILTADEDFENYYGRRADADFTFMPEICASDHDDGAIAAAEANAAKAGVSDCIRFEKLPLSRVKLPGDYGVVICNPPYGERIGDMKEIGKLYKNMGELFNSNRTWSAYILTADEDFENYYGRRADAKRKLYNGTIKTDYYQYHGPRPPKKNE